MTISNLAPQIIARAHQFLRARLPILMLCNKDYVGTPQGVDSTIQIPIPGVAVAASDATYAAYYDPGTKSNNNKTLALTSHIEDGWYLTEPDLAKIAKGSAFLPTLMETSLESLALRIAADIWAVYKGVYAATGAAGTTPFGSTTDVAIDAGQLLDDMKCPQNPRNFLLNSKAKAAVLKLDSFKSFEKRGDIAPLRDNELGRFAGLNWFMDQAVPLHTKGTLATAPLINGAVAADATTMSLDATSLTGTLVTGDVFTIAGDTQQYVVVTGGTAGSNALAGVTFQPPSVAGFADNAALTLVGTHRVNLAFHPNAIYFGSRELAGMTETLTAMLGVAKSNAEYEQVMTDPLTGITLRMVIVRQKNRLVVNFDTLYGVSLVQPKMASRILGEAT